MLKFSKAGIPPVIDIQAEIVTNQQLPTQMQQPKYHAISFQDNGIGFEKEYANRIFDVFQRLHPVHKYPGTGIGLAICKKIMENHRGYIEADSELGAGSRFTIYFPYKE